MLEAATWPPSGVVQLHPAHGSPLVLLDAAGRLHCVSCGGGVIATEVSSQRIWIDVPADWDADRPRRGRQSKWVVAQRVAESAA
jgi:hypothetical protein